MVDVVKATEYFDLRRNDNGSWRADKEKKCSPGDSTNFP